MLKGKMFNSVSRFFDPVKAKKEQAEKERKEEEKKRRSEAFARLRNNKDFQEFFIEGQLKKRIERYSDISNMPDTGNLEMEVFGRKQKLADLKEMLHTINSI